MPVSRSVAWVNSRAWPCGNRRLIWRQLEVSIAEHPRVLGGLGAGASYVDRALQQSRSSGKLSAWREGAANRAAGLTPATAQGARALPLISGSASASGRNHRAAIMAKTGTKSLPTLLSWYWQPR
jgi:hypothetical protein